jgi:methionyl-tRNA synthetase
MFDRYITTTLPYANSKAHIGHALEFVQAQALVNFFIQENENVLFNVGVDEHGNKVLEKAKELGVPVKQYLDEISQEWFKFCSTFEIRPDVWYRTTDDYHKICVQEFWKECKARGDLYKKKYVGLYCVGCESFKTEKELVNGKCPDHNKAPEKIEEENWFFKLGEYKERLLLWLDRHPHFLQPTTKREELRNQILEAEDISVSRLKKNVPWGIEVPGDPEHVIYVWFDALLNYIFSPWKDAENTLEPIELEKLTVHKPNYLYDHFSRYKHFIQICGPDNLRFQGVIFQAFLESAKLPHTEKLLVHGTVLDKDGKKMSKTLGNVIDPIDQFEQYGLDAVKYYILAGLSTYGNSNWNEDDLVKLYNADLANDFGNLISRVLHLVEKQEIVIDESKVEREFRDIVSEKIIHIKQLWHSYEIQQALKETNEIFRFGNRYIDSAKPWDGKSEYALQNLHYLLKKASLLYLPVLSWATNEKINVALQENKKVIIFPRKEISVSV